MMGNPVCTHGVSMEAYCNDCNRSFGPFRRLIEDDAFDAEIARLRERLAQREYDVRAELAAIDAANALRAERDAWASAREALEYYAQSIRDRIVDDGERARSALSRLSSPGAQQTVTPEQIKSRLDRRLNDHLCGMKEGHDDSIVGFNEAWDIMRELFEEIAAFPGGLETPPFKPCVMYHEEICLTEMVLEDTLIIWQPWGPYKGHAVDCGYTEDGRLVGIKIWDDVRTWTSPGAQQRAAEDEK